MSEEKQTKTTTRKKPEPTYTAQEFTRASENLFGEPPYLVSAALRVAGFEEGTKAEALRLVNDFKRSFKK